MIFSFSGYTYCNLILSGWLGSPPWIPKAKMAAFDLNWAHSAPVGVTLAEDYWPVGIPLVRESSWITGGRVRRGTSITIPRAEAAGISTNFYGSWIPGYPQQTNAIVGGDVVTSTWSNSGVLVRATPVVNPVIAGTPTFSVVHGTNPTLTITNPGAASLLTGAGGTPPASAFTVYDGGPTPSRDTAVNPMPISSVTVSTTEVQLSLVGTINLGDVVTITYIPPALMTSNSTPLQDTSGNLFPLVAAEQVTVS